MNEIFNEICILVLGYYMLLNTDNDLVMVDGSDLRMNLGWFSICVTLFYLGVNTMIVLISTIKQIIKRLNSCKK